MSNSTKRLSHWYYRATQLPVVALCRLLVCTKYSTSINMFSEEEHCIERNGKWCESHCHIWFACHGIVCGVRANEAVVIINIIVYRTNINVERTDWLTATVAGWLVSLKDVLDTTKRWTMTLCSARKMRREKKNSEKRQPNGNQMLNGCLGNVPYAFRTYLLRWMGERTLVNL